MRVLLRERTRSRVGLLQQHPVLAAVSRNDAEPVSGATAEQLNQEDVGLPFAALVGMLLAASLAPLGSTMIAVALPSIGHDTHAAAGDLTTWLVTSYLVTS